ncbi:hypothetical protein GSI_09840 [Ganoderma sinense ZZ0214-1]|uniref:Reverse transcriptase n=1 Tax=Ganoderma sinense ZZ0214-1 TaxID=1077348 RepID=A0A2G8S2T8_9APHY|nr:hypothetical protein GSI_09840 [Ganoderma sinense ZZ0214-1]
MADASAPMDGSVLTEAGELVRAKFLAYFDDEEAEVAGLNPEERFSFWCTETTVEVTDHLPAVSCQQSFLDSYEITLEHLADPPWTVSDAIQEAWNEWVAMPAPPDWADGFPDCRTRHKGHPALYWLRACIDKYMTAEYPQLTGTQDLMKVNPYKMGYLLSSVANDDKYFLTHATVHAPGFDITPYAAALVEGHTAEELKFFVDLVSIGSPVPVDICGEDVEVVSSAAADVLDDELEKLWEQLRAEAKDLCQDGATAELPPLREINHPILLIDESKVYSWRPSKCPEALKPVWSAKKRAYLASGRWQMASGVNASPMLILKKPSKGEDDIRIRTIVDKREQNANTHKLAAPLPDIEGILRNVVKHKYRSLIDGKDAYEQIRVVPEHIPRTLFTMPDGTMVSLVLQQGDINGPTMYQTVMNHIFAPYIGVFMDVYLDDIVIYSNTIADHIKHIRIVFDVLRKHKFYLGADKMNFFAMKLKLLGHLIDENGIAMDPHKVECVQNWKVPTNKTLLSSFLGAVGFLAPDCEGICIPMGVLAQLTSSARPWNWTDTYQRAFDQVKEIVHKWRNSRRTALDYLEGAPAINLVTDASLTGGSGYICQGDDVLMAKVILFWSGKFNSAQQNYPVHEQELLAIIESLKWFRHLLYGTEFRICMDHESLEHLMNQKNLSPRQHRWMDVLNEFRNKIHYIPGELNVLADALSRLYSDEPDGIVRAMSEYVGRDGSDDRDEEPFMDILRPVYTGAAAVVDFQPRRSTRLAEHPVPEGTYCALHEGKPRTEPEAGPSRPRRPKATVENAEDSGDEPPAPAETPTAERPVQEPDSQPDSPTIVSTAGDLSMQLPGAFRGRYSEDTYFRKIVSSPSEYPLLVMCRAGPGSNARAWARLWGARAHSNLEPGPQRRLRLGSAGLGLKPGLLACGSHLKLHFHVNYRLGLWRTPSRALKPSKPAIGPGWAQALRAGYPGLQGLKPSPAHHYPLFEYNDGLLYKKHGETYLLCVPDILHGTRRVREILIRHTHLILAHLGYRKTLDALRGEVWWPEMVSDTEAYCRTCGICATTKSVPARPLGMLRPLPVPRRPWQYIALDFVGPLPLSSNRLGDFDMICVIIDQLTSMVHLVPTKQTYGAAEMAEVIFDHVYKLHGLPERIISDRDSLFTSIFWRTLHGLLGTELRLSSSFHPQTDGATERANRTMTQMLRQCIRPDQKDWVLCLPAVELAMNMARSETTGFSPFYLNYGQLPRSLVWAAESPYPGVQAFATRMKDAIMSAHDAIIGARIAQTEQANKKRRKATFQEGDLVYLSTKNLTVPKGRARKLVPKFLGPFSVTKVIVEGATYKLNLPRASISCGLVNAFHASLLRPHYPSDDRRFPGRQYHQIPGFGDNPREWAVDRIVVARAADGGEETRKE